MPTTAGGWPDATVWWGAIVNANTAINYYLQHHPDYFSYVRWVTDIDATGVDYTNAASVAAAKAAYMQAYNSLTALGIAMGSYISGTNVMPLANQDRYTYSVVPKEYMPSNSVYLGTFITSYRFAIDPGDPTTVSAFHTQIAAQWAETSFLKYRFVDNSCSLQGGPYGSWADQMANVRAINLIAQSQGAKAIFNASIIMGSLSSGEMSLLLNAIDGAGICLENPWGSGVRGSASSTANAVTQYRQILDQASAVVMIGYGSGTLATPAELRAWTATWRVDTDPLYLAESFFSFPDPAIYLLSNVPPPPPPLGGGSFPGTAVELPPGSPAIAGAGFDISNSPQGTFAFEHAGSQYAFLCENGVPAAGGFGVNGNGDVSVHALKSTDNGATWIEQDGSHAVSIIYTANGSNAYTVAQDGSTVIVLNVIYADSGGTDIITGIQTTTFDLTSDTWGTPSAHTTSIVDFMGFDRTTQGHEVLVKLLVRGSGDYILYHSGTQEVSGVTGHKLARVYYTTFNGSSFGSSVELPGQSGSQYFFNGTSACVDSSGRVHFFYQNNHFVSLGNPLFHVGLDSGGTFGTMQTITNAIYYTTNISTGQCSEPIVFSGTIAIAANVAIAGFDQNIWLFYAAEALDPVWNSSVINTDQSNEPSLKEFYLEPQDIALAFSGGILACVWTVDGHPGTFWSSTSSATALAWTTPALSFTASGTNMFAYQVYAFAMSIGIGVLGFSESTSDTEEAQFFGFTPTGFPPGGGGGFPPVIIPPFRIIVDLYGDTQLSALLPADAPVGTLPAVVIT